VLEVSWPATSATGTPQSKAATTMVKEEEAYTETILTLIVIETTTTEVKLKKATSTSALTLTESKETSVIRGGYL
jgi:hypothetical protein